MNERRELKISHETRYRFAAPATYGVYRIRLTPMTCLGQQVRDWRIAIEGGAVEADYSDYHGNRVALASVHSGTEEIMIRASGVVVVEDRAGMLGHGSGGPPLWLYGRQTARTKPLATLTALIEDCRHMVRADDVATLHELSAEIRRHMPYDLSMSDVAATAEEALARGRGVCQDHAHVFVAVCRALGVPARYVSGYLMLKDSINQEAGHAWAEAYVPALGWVGFDISNAQCPDARYARLAIGLDYGEAAPITGLLVGRSQSDMNVMIEVQQQ